MHLLLDTHVLLWALLTPGRLDGAALALIENKQNKVWFSAASIWEIAIKAELKRDDFKARPEAVNEFAIDAGFTEMPVRADAALRVETLPLYHRDPFDRLLIAQALQAPAHFLTADATLKQYSELVTLVG